MGPWGFTCTDLSHTYIRTYRPALDSVEAAVDRAVRMPAERFQGKSEFRPLPFFWQGSKKVS